MDIAYEHSSFRIPAEIVDLILSYTSCIPYYAGVCRSMYEISMKRFKEWKDVLEQKYPCWNIPKKHPQLGLSEQQRQILKFHLNRAALTDDWDIFKFILNPQSDEEQIVVDAHNLCILFNNDKLASHLNRCVKTDKMQRKLYRGRDPFEWNPMKSCTTYFPWRFTYYNNFRYIPEMEIKQMLESDYCTQSMIDKFIVLIKDIKIIQLPLKVSNIILYSYIRGKGLLFPRGTRYTPSMELSCCISNNKQIDKKQLQREAMQY